jgi:hypothetical protein
MSDFFEPNVSSLTSYVTVLGNRDGLLTGKIYKDVCPKMFK